jgi:hypothetical protein
LPHGCGNFQQRPSGAKLSPADHGCWPAMTLHTQFTGYRKLMCGKIRDSSISPVLNMSELQQQIARIPEYKEALKLYFN